MAKSLKCNQCGKLLASVKEAQDHNEVTGHTNFEETTEVLKVQRCTTCGKPCRTDAERDMHTRFTGHATFEDATDAGTTLNTEAQMKEARDAMEIDGDDDVVAAALKKKKQQQPQAQAQQDEGSAGASTSEQGGEEEMVEPEVDTALLEELLSMGFGRNRAVRAIHCSGGGGAEGAVNWLMEHEGDADIDEPLKVSKASAAAGPKLTPEEARKKAEELVRKAKERREREEREAEALRERERIRAGKEMQAAKRKEEEGAMKRLVEQRQREKEEEARAREKLRLQLEEDRRERRKRLGLPEELTEEEKAKEAEKLAKKQAEEAQKQKVFNVVKPITAIERLRGVMVNMKKVHSAAGEDERWRTAAATLQKYLANVARAPEEDKFRSIKLGNAAFQQRVASANGGVEFLELCGFEKTAVEGGETALVMAKDKVNVELINMAGGLLQDALTNPFFGAL